MEGEEFNQRCFIVGFRMLHAHNLPRFELKNEGNISPVLDSDFATVAMPSHGSEKTQRHGHIG